MLYWLADFSDKVSILNVFRYLTVRTGGAAGTGFLFVFLFGSSIICGCGRARDSRSAPMDPSRIC
jgi:phospho-N-acetylmuramoyl-pentapeptide-transferase